MKNNVFAIFLICFIQSNLYAQSESIIEMSNGACWLNFSKDQFRLASFNDKSAINKSYDQINSDALEFILTQKFFASDIEVKNMAMGVHCGGYGTSLVFKIDTNNGDYCFWSKLNNGKLELRSFGVVSGNREFCTGRKLGEVLVGVSDRDVIDQLKSDLYKKYIINVEAISKSTVKLTFNPSYHLKEDEVIEKLKIDFSKDQIRYYEFNEFRHPVGEYIQVYK